MGMSAQEKITLIAASKGCSVEEILKRERGIKNFSIEVVLIIFDIDLKYIDQFKNMSSTVDLIEDLQLLQEQLHKKPIAQDKELIKRLTTEIQDIKGEFMQKMQGIDEAIAKREELKEVAKQLKSDLKPFALEFIQNLEKIMQTAQDAGVAKSYDHLANFKHEFVRYSILSKEDLR